jgi:hypothetical protein
MFFDDVIVAPADGGQWHSGKAQCFSKSPKEKVARTTSHCVLNDNANAPTADWRQTPGR